jgi:hypothetical protein
VPPEISKPSGYTPASTAAPTRAYNTTMNLADLAAASCKGGPNEAAGDAAAAAAQAAANKLGDANAIYFATAYYADNPAIVSAMNYAAIAAAAAYNQAKACGGVPPDVPDIPHYSETFWDIAS